MTDLRDQLQQTLGAAYTLERELGGGGMARVFVAEETALGRMVVVKVLPPDLSAELSVERFRREARLAAGLQHPHVVPVLATGGSAGVLYYTMPFVEGESLRVWLERERQLPVLDAVQLAREVAEALAYAHGRGVVHRDVKPENILLSGGHALLTDFGIAKALEHARGETLTATGLSLGTPNYMAPEQAAGERDVDGRADIYALGCVLYEMLAGKPPFNGPTAQSVVAQHLAAPFPQVRHSRPDVPEAIDEVIRRATAKAPADRYPTAAAFAAGLAAPLSEPAGGRASGERTTRTARGRGPMRAAIGVAAVLILGIGGWLRVRGSRLAFDQNLIAIGPFEVLDPQLQLWREGMADVLARNLDGAGALRTVAPTTVLRRWRGPSDLVSAAAISRSTGARYVVLGRLSPSGRDTLRLTAEVADAATNRSVATIELRDAADHVDRLADSASVGVLREFERVRRFSGARLMSIGTRSLPALKAFLTGEQFYRRNEFDSALVEYRRAIEFDSTFALALRRAAWAIEDPGYYGDPLAMAYALRAGRFNRGLSVRDSLLVLADSIYAAEPQYDPAKSRRHIAVLTDAARRYPDDVDVWYALACALIYEGYTASDVAGAYPAFQRVVAIDSEFLPGLSVASFMAIQGDKIDDAIRYARMYAKLRPSSATPRIILNFVDRPSRPSEALALADTVSAQSAVEVLWALGRWIDSTEAGVQVARRILKRPPAANTALWEEARRLAVWELAHRGHMAEAIACAMAADANLFRLDGALLGVEPRAVGNAAAKELLDHRTINQSIQFWLVATHDAVGLLAWSTIFAEWGKLPPAATRSNVEMALARGDSAAALGLCERHPAYSLWIPEHLFCADLFVRSGRGRAALTLLDDVASQWDDRRTTFWPPYWIRYFLIRAAAAEAAGERVYAVRSYQDVVRRWRHADSGLQAYVLEARAGLSRLGSPE